MGYLRIPLEEQSQMRGELDRMVKAFSLLVQAQVARIRGMAAAAYLWVGQSLLVAPDNQLARIFAGDLDEYMAKMAVHARASAGDSNLQLLLAKNYRALGRYREAEDCYRAALAVNPALTDAILGLEIVRQVQAGLREADQNSDRQEWESAVQRYLKLFEIEPQCASAWDGIGRARSAQGQDAAAAEAYWRALAFRPDLVSSIRALATYYEQRTSHLAQAWRLAQRAYQLSGEEQDRVQADRLAASAAAAGASS